MGMALMLTWTRLMRRAKGQMPTANQRLKMLELVQHSTCYKHHDQRQDAEVKKLKACQRSSWKA